MEQGLSAKTASARKGKASETNTRCENRDHPHARAQEAGGEVREDGVVVPPSLTLLLRSNQSG